MPPNAGAVILPMYAPDREEVASYYRAAAQNGLLSFLQDRPVYFSQADGVEFRRAPELTQPDVLGDLALQGAVELRVANTQPVAPQRPAWLALSFRPGVQTGWNLFASAEAAQRLLTELGFEFFWKVSGQGGLHLLLPLRPQHGFRAVTDFARMLAELIASRVPDAATTRPLRHSRRVYIETGANRREQWLLPPFSVRAGLPPRVSLPLTWSQLREALASHGAVPEFDLATSSELLQAGGVLVKRALANPNELEPGFIVLETALQSAI